jgi:CRISPR-associated Cas5-like protein
MRTAIFVYQPTLLGFETNETDILLCGMNATPVPVSPGVSTQSIAPGIYKIFSSHGVKVTGDEAAFGVVVTTSNKDTPPTPPPSAITILGPFDDAAMQVFFATPESKSIQSP